MTTFELKLTLPDRLAKDAAQMGLFESESLQSLLREAVRSRRIAQLALLAAACGRGRNGAGVSGRNTGRIDAHRVERRQATNKCGECWIRMSSFPVCCGAVHHRNCSLLL